MPGFDVLDPELNIHRNYFLEASAGTGKTFTIENLVIRLLLEGISIDQILIVTFTRAATIELKTRIRENLMQKGLKEPLACFDEAKIFTIHGFCFHTLKEYAIETGFALNQVEESASIDVLKRIIKDFLRTELTTEEIDPHQLEKVLKQHRNDHETFITHLAMLANQRLPLKGGRSFQEIKKEIEDEIRILKFNREDLFQNLCAWAKNFNTFCDRKQNLKPEIEKGLTRFSHFFEGELDNLIDLPLIKMVPENLKKRAKEYPELLQTFNRRLIPLLKEISDGERIFNHLVERAHAFLEKVIEKEELFFFEDLLRKMQKSVKDPKFAHTVRQNYRAVLIDEFQDTDPVQWEIFSTLFHGYVPLYLVGDPKQSIYRFRGADLYTYMKAKEQFGKEANASLSRNFRAAPSLVEGLNLLFAKVPDLISLPKLQQTLSIAPVEPALTTSEKGEITFCQAPDEKTFFSYIIQEIERLHRVHHLPLSSCAILVKDRYQAKRFTTQCPLPATTKRSESLLESAAFPVLEDLLLAAYNPRERSHIAKALGGPLFGFSLEKLGSGFDEQIERFYVYHHLLEKKGILTFFQTVITENLFPGEKLYLDLLQLVEMIAEQTQAIDEYLPYLQKLKQEDAESEHLKARAQCEEEAIQVMTIHVSKGLEFDTVFPVGLICDYTQKDEEDLSEQMRQLYVALTRAKTRLYLPVMEKERSPMHHFFSRVFAKHSIETFVEQNSQFSLVRCEKKTISFSQKNKKPLFTPPKITLDYSPLLITSYSTLVQKHESTTSSSLPKNDEIPAGTHTGIVLHQIFEALPYDRLNDDLKPFIRERLQGTHLEPWEEKVHELVVKTFHTPLSTPSGTFCLAELDPKKIIKEMEFLYWAPESKGFMKGFIDLFFERQDRYYLIDWKSNFLEGYTSHHLEEAIRIHQYDLQAKIYREACEKYLNIFNIKEKFEGSFYFFLRGPTVYFI